MNKIKLTEPKASLYPTPVTLISCEDTNTANIITVSWTGIMCSSPPILYISIRPSRFSYQILMNNDKFCLNIPHMDLLKQVDFCGRISGKAEDKIESCNFDMISLIDGYPKAIKQCKHHLFCDTQRRIELGSHTAFIAEVKHEFIDENCVDINHQLDYGAIQPIGYCRKKYYSFSQDIGTYGGVF